MLNKKERGKINSNIKYYRKLRKLTQKELAKKVNISERQLQRIEIGGQEPKTSTSLKIANALDTTVEDLFEIPQRQLRETSPSKK